MEENKSLYWNPAIYKVVNQANSQKTYELVPVWFASAYYIWRTGEEGFKYCTKNNEGFVILHIFCRLLLVHHNV